MKVLLFGKNGQVARALLARTADDLIIEALDRDQADLSAPDICTRWIQNTDADVVINAAAYTAVDHAESDEAAATLINGQAPGAMASACAARDIPFLHISTDYVFDGAGSAARAPDAATAPINAYGRSKLAGELAVRSAGGRHVILRTSWVFSSHGSNFVKTMLRLAQARDALSVVGDQIGGPTAAEDIASALIAVSRGMIAGAKGGTYHFAGHPPVSWADFAREIFRQAGQDVTVTDIPSSAYPTPAQRPMNSRLSCETLSRDFGIAAPDWRSSLTRVLADLKQEI